MNILNYKSLARNLKRGFVILLPVFVAVSVYPVQAIDFDPTIIGLKTDSATVRADGIDQAIVTVRVRNINRIAVPGVKVELVSSRGGLEEITPKDNLTNSFGEARFNVRSLKNGTTEISAVVAEDYPSTHSVEITFEDGLDLSLPAGSLIKIPSDNDPNTYSDTAVYYYASDGKRYVFPNEKVYFTWYSTFADVQILSLEDMTKIPIGGNVTYRPGSKLVKFQTDNKVYAVYQNGLLRWVPTEELAQDLYGENWMNEVDDINESFYVNYSFGQPIEHRLDFSVDTIYNKFSTIEKDKQIY